MCNHTLFYSSVCPDTEAFVAELDRLNIPYTEVNITASMSNLKQFLKLRDNMSAFDVKKEKDQVGVPVLVNENQDEFIFDSDKLVELKFN